MSEREYVIAKAERSWKNITAYQDERAQGRATARNGRGVVQGGLAAGAFGAGLSSPWAADVLGFKPSGNVAGFRSEMGDVRRNMRVNQALPRSQRLGIAARQTGRTLLRHPGPAAMAGGLGAVGVGSGMWATGRVKARNADRNIARLRRQRAGR